MSISLDAWVEQYCPTCDDAPSFRFMKVFAIRDALRAKAVIDAFSEQGEETPEFQQDLDEALGHYAKLDARQKELGFDTSIPRGYGLTPEQIVAFEKILAARDDV